MSLKAFHIVFIVASVLLAFGFGWWELESYRSSGAKADLAMGVGACVTGVVLVIYGRYFLKKLKHISYL
jgi:ABC-type uncharacterized transport system permease subunit